MGIFIVLVLLVVVALVTGIAAGVSFEQNKSVKGFGLCVVAFTITGFLAIGTHQFTKKQTLSHLEPTKEAVYVVLKIVPDEKGAFLVLLDTRDNNEQVAHLAVYPPDGYSETVLPDGRTILAVTGRQIVVGDPDKADFVPPKK